MAQQPVPQPERLTCRAPATGQVIATLPVDDPDAVRAAVERSRVAQRAWGARSIASRAQVLLRFRDLLVSHGPELAKLLSVECGKPEIEAFAAEIFNLIDMTTWVAKRAHRVLAPQSLALHLFKHRASYLHFVPRGVVGVIAPWNFPLVIPFGDVVFALLAGNGVVVKPSEETPLIALRARELLVEAGVPDDLVQVVVGFGPTGAALIEAGIDKVVFTGSVATGRRVAMEAADRLIPATLELGGKAPAIILPDADLDRAARALLWGAFSNSGQVCCSVERVYVHRSVHDALVDKVVQRTERLRQGDPAEGPVDVGAIIHRHQIDVARDQVEQAVAAGATVRIGGAALEGPGQFFAPTVLTGVKQDMLCARSETFGPLLPFMVYDDVDEAIAMANDSHLGLLAYVFTADVAAGRALAERIEAGTVMVNDVLATHGMPETPWAGVKQSGLGRVHSEMALRDMCQTRHVNYPRVPPLAREIWWYPYRGEGYALLLRLTNTLFGKGLFARFAKPPVPRDVPLVLPAAAQSSTISDT